MKRAQKDVPIFNVWTLIVQSLNIKEWILLDLQITQTGYPQSFRMDKFNTPQKWEERIGNVHKVGGAHL